MVTYPTHNFKRFHHPHPQTQKDLQTLKVYVRKIPVYLKPLNEKWQKNKADTFAVGGTTVPKLLLGLVPGGHRLM